jgi:peptide/nickel transport system ATP-binding protein
MDRKNDVEIQDMAGPPLLRMSSLSVAYRTEKGAVKALEDVSFEIEKGVNFGLVGESGCGKTTLLKAVVGALPPNAAVTGGRIVFEGCELTRLDERQMRRIRWRRISMITQSAMNALDPVYKVGDRCGQAAC